MKTINFISTMALFGALMTATAQGVEAQVNDATEKTSIVADSAKLYVAQSKPMQFRVVFNNPKSPKIAVRILDSNGDILFSETKAVESAYLRYFDLSPLHDGVYTFEIVDGQEKYNQSFDILTRTRRIVSSVN